MAQHHPVGASCGRSPASTLQKAKPSTSRAASRPGNGRTGTGKDRYTTEIVGEKMLMLGGGGGNGNHGSGGGSGGHAGSGNDVGDMPFNPEDDIPFLPSPIYGPIV